MDKRVNRLKNDKFNKYLQHNKKYNLENYIY